MLQIYVQMLQIYGRMLQIYGPSLHNLRNVYILGCKNNKYSRNHRIGRDFLILLQLVNIIQPDPFQTEVILKSKLYIFF